MAVHHAADRLDILVVSAEEGVAKPDPRIYAIAADRLGVRPEGCVFVDDQPRKNMVITFIPEGLDVGLPADQAEQKRQYDARLRPLLAPERRHIIEDSGGE